MVWREISEWNVLHCRLRGRFSPVATSDRFVLINRAWNCRSGSAEPWRVSYKSFHEYFLPAVDVSVLHPVSASSCTWFLQDTDRPTYRRTTFTRTRNCRSAGWPLWERPSNFYRFTPCLPRKTVLRVRIEKVNGVEIDQLYFLRARPKVIQCRRKRYQFWSSHKEICCN